MANPRLESVVSSLERELARERAVLLVNESVEAIVDRWDELASQSEEDDPYFRVLDFLRKLRIDVNSLPTWPAATSASSNASARARPPKSATSPTPSPPGPPASDPSPLPRRDLCTTVWCIE